MTMQYYENHCGICGIEHETDDNEKLVGENINIQRCKTCSKIFCFGVCFSEHLKETGHKH